MMPCQEQFSSHLGSHCGSIPPRGCRRSSECFSKLIFFSLEWIMSISRPGHRKKGSCRSVQGVRGGEGVGLRAPARPHRPPCVQRLHPGALQPWEKKEKKEERKEMDDELVEEQSRDICHSEIFSFQFSGKLILLHHLTMNSVFPCFHSELSVRISVPKESPTSQCRILQNRKPTFLLLWISLHLFLKNFFVFKKRNYFNFGIQAAAPGYNAANHRCLGGGAEAFYMLLFFFLNLHFVRILLCILFPISKMYMSSIWDSALRAVQTMNPVCHHWHLPSAPR